jgi:hypothetical protein
VMSKWSVGNCVGFLSGAISHHVKSPSMRCPDTFERSAAAHAAAFYVRSSESLVSSSSGATQSFR